MTVANVGIDLGGTNLKFAVIDTDDKIIVRHTIPTDGHQGHDPVIARMVQGVREMQAKLDLGTTIESIGIGVPGMVDMVHGIMLDLPNLAGKWTNVPLKEILERELGIPTHILNDVKGFTLAEYTAGAAKGATNAIFYAIGTGIGGGLVIDGKVHFGLGGAAGEFGHIIVSPGGVLCSCGNRGCVESLSSGPAIIAEANRRVVQGFTTHLTELINDDLNKTTPGLVEQAAEAGDPIAIDVLERAGYYLGLSMAGMIAAVAPELVVVGGGVVKPHGVYWKSFVTTAIANNTVTDMTRVSFVPASLGYEAGVTGAAMWGRLVQQGHATPVT
ncbi:MAG TPA: ROK family protein [Thermomicrobiales bacterium]|nr:ROK family protein [Thermomicrobiales bacterium]